MKNYVESALKRHLKKRKRVTEALIVTFLITGSLSYGMSINEAGNYTISDNQNNISVNSSDIINLTIDGSVVAPERTSISHTLSNSYNTIKTSSGNTTIINNGFIKNQLNVDTSTSSTNSSTVDSSGNGVYASLKSNNGKIESEANITTGYINKGHTTGVTAVAEWTVESKSDLRSSGNGVNGGIGTNDGIVKGMSGVVTGDALASARNLNPDISIVTQSIAEANSSLRSSSSGNGIHGYVDKNNGIIKGIAKGITGDVQATSSNTNTNSSSTSKVTANSGITSSSSGNGMYGDVERNKGTIEGNVYSQSGDLRLTAESSGGDYNSNVNTHVNQRYSGNGIQGNIKKVNTGIIRGVASAKNGKINVTTSSPTGGSKSTASGARVYLSGNGISGTIIENKGISVGNLKIDTGIRNTDGVSDGKASEIRTFSGSGMAYESTLTKDIANKGILAGSDSAIALRENTTHTGAITNYGILGGRVILSNGLEEIVYSNPTNNISFEDMSSSVDYTNHGIEVKFNNDEDKTIASITNGSGGIVDIAGEEFTILNADLITGNTDSYNEITTATAYNNHIINGAGVATGALTVDDSELLLNNSIVNGYEKAITLKGDASLTATDTVFNGGGIGTWNDNGTSDDITDDYLEYTNVVEGDSGDNRFNLLGESVVNGTIDLGDGSDSLTVSTNSQLNGNIVGGLGEDFLTLGDMPVVQNESLRRTGADNSGGSLNIYHNIDGFEKINVEGSVTLYETSKVIGANDINILKDSTLNLRIDPTQKTADGKVKGHALYNSGATVSGWNLQEYDGRTGEEGDTSEGALNLVTNGLGIDSVIAMGDTTLDDNLYIRTDSLINKAEKLPDGDVQVSTGKDLASVFEAPIDPTNPVDPTDPTNPTIPGWIGKNHYTKLDGVYKSIGISGDDNINALFPTVNLNDKTKDNAGENLLLLLNDIFMANPYGYVTQASRETLGLFNEMALNNPFKPEAGEWMVYGGGTYGDGDYDSNYKNHINKNYYGFDTYNNDVSSNSKVYGGYALAEYGITDKTSAGLVFGGANSDTDISNGSKLDGDVLYVGAYGKTEVNNFKFTSGAGYQYGDYETTRVARNMYQHHEYENDIQSNGITAYAEAAYEYALSSKWSLEPKVRVSYMRLKQKSADEGNEVLAIETDSKSVTFWDTETGIDLVREITYANSKAHLKAGVSYLYSLEGHEADYVTGRMKGGSDFDILIPEQDQDRIGVKVAYDVEHENGLIYNLGGGYVTGSDTDQYYGSVGIGYKFLSLK